jgi:hypothetical protein
MMNNRNEHKNMGLPEDIIIPEGAELHKPKKRSPMCDKNDPSLQEISSSIPLFKVNKGAMKGKVFRIIGNNERIYVERICDATRRNKQNEQHNILSNSNIEIPTGATLYNQHRKFRLCHKYDLTYEPINLSITLFKERRKNNKGKIFYIKEGVRIPVERIGDAKRRNEGTRRKRKHKQDKILNINTEATLSQPRHKQKIASASSHYSTPMPELSPVPTTHLERAQPLLTPAVYLQQNTSNNDTVLSSFSQGDSILPPTAEDPIEEYVQGGNSLENYTLLDQFLNEDLLCADTNNENKWDSSSLDFFKDDHSSLSLLPPTTIQDPPPEETLPFINNDPTIASPTNTYSSHAFIMSFLKISPQNIPMQPSTEPQSISSSSVVKPLVIPQSRINFEPINLGSEEENEWNRNYELL